MNKLTLSALGAFSMLLLAAPAAHAQVVAVAPAVQPASLPSTSVTAVVTGYVTDAAGTVQGVQLSNGMIAVVGDASAQQTAATVAVGTQVRVDGLVDPASPQTIYQAGIFTSAGVVLVQPPVAYVPGSYYPAYTGYSSAPYYGGARPYYASQRPYYAPQRPYYAPPVYTRPAYVQPAYVQPAYVQPAYAQPVRPAYPGGGWSGGQAGGFRGGYGGGAVPGGLRGGYQGGFHGGFHGGRR